MSQFIEMFGNCKSQGTLSSLCATFIDGDWIESKDQSDNGIRLIQTGNVGFGFFKGREDKSRYITEETFKKLNCTEVVSGDILISRLPDPIGRACIVPEGIGKAITAVDCTIVRLNATLLPEFLISFSKTALYASQINKIKTGTTRLRVSRGNLGNVIIPIPPIESQHHFAAIAQQADKSKFGDFKSQFIEMFGGLCQDTPWSDVVTITNGKAYPEEYQEEGAYPICGSGGIMCYGEKKLCNGNTTILGRKGNINNPIFMESGYWIVDTAFSIDVDKAKLHPKFFYYWCCQYDFTKLNKQGVLPSLTRKDLEKVKMAIPQMRDQLKFVSIAEQADKSKSVIQKALVYLNDIQSDELGKIA